MDDDKLVQICTTTQNIRSITTGYNEALIHFHFDTNSSEFNLQYSIIEGIILCYMYKDIKNE